MSHFDPQRTFRREPVFAQFVDVTTGRLCSNLKDTGSMTDIVGYWLSSLIALGIIVIGARFFLAPHAAAVAFGVPVPPDPRWEAYLSVKAIRDIASGFFIGILILSQAPHVLGWFMLAATIIPLTDAGIVLGHGGTKGTAYGIHGVTAGVMLIISGLLLLG
jgi:hypothetical protein